MADSTPSPTSPPSSGPRSRPAPGAGANVSLSYAFWLGLDIGGANIKASHPSGVSRTMPFELWKHPEDLPRSLASLLKGLPEAHGLAVTMTAELCDCYATKEEGVNDVLNAVEQVARHREVWIWGIDGRFHKPAVIREEPRRAAAANWLALAILAARLAPRGPAILIDIGSTTTDLIPIQDGRPIPRGRTDTQRLQTGELVYAGVRRTPVATLATELRHRGVPTGLTSETFATTADLYLALGETEEDPSDLGTADGRPLTLEATRDRLARMIGADRSEFSLDDARELAREADHALMDRLVTVAKRCCFGQIGRPRTAIVAGQGEFLARRLALRLLASDGQIVSLREAWGETASAAGCAYAVMKLAIESLSDPPRTSAPPTR